MSTTAICSCDQARQLTEAMRVRGDLLEIGLLELAHAHPGTTAHKLLLDSLLRLAQRMKETP